MPEKKVDVEPLFFASLYPTRDSHPHDFEHWAQPDGKSWKIRLCPICGMLELYASLHDPVYTRWLDEKDTNTLLAMNRFAMRWHKRGYDKYADEMELPEFSPTFSFHYPSRMELNTDMVITYFLYEKVKT